MHHNNNNNNNNNRNTHFAPTLPTFSGRRKNVGVRKKKEGVELCARELCLTPKPRAATHTSEGKRRSSRSLNCSNARGTHTPQMHGKGSEICNSLFLVANRRRAAKRSGRDRHSKNSDERSAVAVTTNNNKLEVLCVCMCIHCTSKNVKIVVVILCVCVYEVRVLSTEPHGRAPVFKETDDGKVFRPCSFALRLFSG